ncbi:MAG TPA: archease [Candidatus Altiarchaeales archaeon]|nr:archease [Candidatus Altiarchaeales archaeon]
MTYSKDFEFIDHIADLEFISYGKTLNECFRNAARALWGSIVNPDSVDVTLMQKIEIKSDTLEALLHDFLSESLFIFETDGIVFKNFNVSIKKDKNYTLFANLHGEKFNPEKHIIGADVKAVTYHKMIIKKEKGTWSARVICDI